MNVATSWIRKESKHGVRVRRDQVREATGHAGGETREAPGLVRGGMNFTQAAHAVGVSKRTGKVWRNGRTRSTGPRAAARGPVPWRHGRAQADRRRTPVHGRAYRHRRHAPCRQRRPCHRPDPGRAPSTNENTNGLLRQYSPKGTDPSGYTEEYLDAVATEPNDRPRKTLDYMKPSEKIPELIDDTATSTPTDTINTNCQQRCCDNH